MLDTNLFKMSSTELIKFEQLPSNEIAMIKISKHTRKMLLIPQTIETYRKINQSIREMRTDTENSRLRRVLTFKKIFSQLVASCHILYRSWYKEYHHNPHYYYYYKLQMLYDARIEQALRKIERNDVIQVFLSTYMHHETQDPEAEDLLHSIDALKNDSIRNDIRSLSSSFKTVFNQIENDKNLIEVDIMKSITNAFSIIYANVPEKERSRIWYILTQGETSGKSVEYTGSSQVLGEVKKQGIYRSRIKDPLSNPVLIQEIAHNYCHDIFDGIDAMKYKDIENKNILQTYFIRTINKVDALLNKIDKLKERLKSTMDFAPHVSPLLMNVRKYLIKSRNIAFSFITETGLIHFHHFDQNIIQAEYNKFRRLCNVQ